MSNITHCMPINKQYVKELTIGKVTLYKSNDFELL